MTVEIREVQKLYAELTMPRPSDGCSLDGDGGSEIGCPNQQTDTGARIERYGACDGATAGGNVEHRTFTDIAIAGCGEKDLEIDRDSLVCSAFNHGSLRSALKVALPVLIGASIDQTAGSGMH